MIHAHITTWLLAIILFFVAIGLHNSGKQKGFKVVHMIIRLFYLLIFATGAMLLFSLSNISMLYILKSAAGLWVIATLEMILVRTAKQKTTNILWIQFAAAFLLVLYLGLSLPLGMNFF